MTIRTKTIWRLFARFGLGLSLLLTAGIAAADYGLQFQQPVTSIAERLLELHNLIVIIVVVIFFIVFGFMFYSMIVHRKSRGHKPAKWHENTTLEVVWTVIPFIILVSMAIPSTATLLFMDDDSGSEMTVRITGIQWKWKYDYLDYKGLSFISTLSTPREQIGSPMFSKNGFKAGTKKGKNYLLEVDEPLVLPVGKKIRFLIAADDVIHSWWVPQLGIKKDAIPGLTNSMWVKIDKPGTYRGQCAELCGKDHGFMPIVVKAVSQKDFDRWVNNKRGRLASARRQQVAAAGKTWSKPQLMARGKEVYAKNCSFCHGANGEGIGAFPKMAGSKITTGPVKQHINIILNGKNGTAMRAFKADLSKADIAAVVTYERNAFGNKTGDVIQPSDIK